MHDLGPAAHGVAGLLAHDEVHVAVAHARLLGEVGVQHGQRSHRLGRHLPGVGEDAQLAAARGTHPAVEEDVVAEVDVGLEIGQALLAEDRLRGHDLQALAGAVLERDEGQLARVALEDDAPRDSDEVLCLLTGLQVTVLRTHRGDGGGHGDGDGVGLLAARQQPLPLGLADRDLVGGVRRVGGRGILAHAGDCLITALHMAREDQASVTTATAASSRRVPSTVPATVTSTSPRCRWSISSSVTGSRARA